MDDLLAHPQFHSYTLEDVQRVVATDDKQRFKLCSHPDDGRLQIRANQGHSVQAGRADTSLQIHNKSQIQMELHPIKFSPDSNLTNSSTV